MTGSIVLRLGGYPEIDVWEFRDWFLKSYFKIPPKNDTMYLDKFDVDISFTVDEDDKIITIGMDLVDYSEMDNMSESLKRELREISRGGLD